MEQGNYKTLILKLLGTALGLVVMLAGAVALSQNILSDKSVQVENAEVYAYSTSPLEELSELATLNYEFKVAAEEDKWNAEIALAEAERVLADMKSVKVEKLIHSQTAMIMGLSEAIGEIASQTAIPTALKENIIEDLERQLEKNEQKLQILEEQIVNYSYEMVLPSISKIIIPPQLKYNGRSSCKEEAVIEEEAEQGTTGGRKTSATAFSWI